MTLFLTPRWQPVDISLSALLAVQVLTLFIAIPLGTAHPAAHLLLDACHLAFALVCITILTRHRPLQGLLLALVVLLAAGPIVGDRLTRQFGFPADAGHQLIALTAFAFNAAVTALIARHVFGPGRVTAHRVQGAVLLYLNVAALFAIAYGAIASALPGAIIPVGGGLLTQSPGVRTAAMTYFSLSTITTSGFGDFIPVHPLVRSLTNLEAVFGQLFPATLLARIVALHLAHDRQEAT